MLPSITTLLWLACLLKEEICYLDDLESSECLRGVRSAWGSNDTGEGAWLVKVFVGTSGSKLHYMGGRTVKLTVLHVEHMQQVLVCVRLHPVMHGRHDSLQQARSLQYHSCHVQMDLSNITVAMSMASKAGTLTYNWACLGQEPDLDGDCGWVALHMHP